MVTVKRGLLADTDEGKEILLALGSADKLSASHLLDLSVVYTASSNAIGWSTVESLTGASWCDYCTNEKHALVVKDALAAQEKRATDAYERDRKDRERTDRGRGGRRDHDADGYRSRRSFRAAAQEATGELNSWNSYNGQYIPPPSGAPPRYGS